MHCCTTSCFVTFLVAGTCQSTAVSNSTILIPILEHRLFKQKLQLACLISLAQKRRERLQADIENISYNIYDTCFEPNYSGIILVLNASQAMLLYPKQQSCDTSKPKPHVLSQLAAVQKSVNKHTGSFVEELNS